MPHKQREALPGTGRRDSVVFYGYVTAAASGSKLQLLFFCQPAFRGHRAGYAVCIFYYIGFIMTAKSNGYELMKFVDEY